MATQYENTTNVTTSGSNEVAEIPYPGRCTFDNIVILLAGGGSITADIFSRAFEGPEVNVIRITSDEAGKCYVELGGVFPCKVGDTVVIAGNTVSGYNTSHVVTFVQDDYNVVTDQNYTANGFGGTAQVQIPDADQELYRVTPTITGNSPLQVALNVAYKNQDPLPNANIGINRVVYIKFASAGSYRVALRSHEGIGLG